MTGPDTTGTAGPALPRWDRPGTLGRNDRWGLFPARVRCPHDAARAWCLACTLDERRHKRRRPLDSGHQARISRGPRAPALSLAGTTLRSWDGRATATSPRIVGGHPPSDSRFRGRGSCREERTFAPVLPGSPHPVPDCPLVLLVAQAGANLLDPLGRHLLDGVPSREGGRPIGNTASCWRRGIFMTASDPRPAGQDKPMGPPSDAHAPHSPQGTPPAGKGVCDGVGSGSETYRAAVISSPSACLHRHSERRRSLPLSKDR